MPKVGTYLRPDAESIARLKPDLVIVHKLPNELTNRLAALHIAYAEVDRGGLIDAYSEIRQIGEATGAKAQAVPTEKSVLTEPVEFARTSRYVASDMLELATPLGVGTTITSAD